MHTKNILSIAFTITFVLAVFQPTAFVQAQAGSATDLINAVNAYRAEYGLEAYQIDGGLVALAQSHSEYQASVQTCTYLRADGTGPADYGISAENIACGIDLSIQTAIYYQWADALHTATLTGPTSGLVGAGVSTAGSMVYYTLVVKRLSGDFEYRPPISQEVQPDDISSDADTIENQADAFTYNFQIPVSTPNEDGSIAHVVRYGETLTMIAEAYGIPLSELISMNKLDPANPAIFEGQPLLIRVAFTSTPFITATYTPRPPTRTPLPTRTLRPTRTATPYLSPTPTSTATIEPLIRIPTLEELGPARPVLAYVAFGVSFVALVALIVSAFWSGNRK